MPNNMNEMKKMMKENKKSDKPSAAGKMSLEEKLANATAPMREKMTHKAAAAKKGHSGQFIAEHKVVSGDTLSGIALAHYGTAVRDKWMAIYEANKEIIGDNPNLIRVGQVLRIPKLD